MAKKNLSLVTQNSETLLGEDEERQVRKHYRVNEIFYSLQGEGVRAGTPNLFIRFSGCNLSCSVESHGFDCDTEFVSGVSMSVEAICGRLVEDAPGCKSIILTGGEPLLQVDARLCQELKERGYFLAVETNGSIEPAPEVLSVLDWITCSPKVAEHAVRLSRCDELKYVRAYGQGVPKPKLSDCQHKLISPAFAGDSVDSRTLQWCIELVRKNPEWRLSVQQHKQWQVR